jgi:outer membrane lipoprotein carrier protein
MKAICRTSGFIAVLALLAPVHAAAQCVGLGRLVDGVEGRLESMRDLSADFVQFQEDDLNQTSREEGHLYLKRPRMMRWAYDSPEEKLFVSDGDWVYLYAPADRQVHRDRASDTFDDRIPLMFLLGRSDLEREFTGFLSVAETRVEGTCGMRMFPARESDIEEIGLEVEPDTFDIRRMVFRFVDGSFQELILGEVRTDSGLDDELFEFSPPPGVRVVEGLN